MADPTLEIPAKVATDLIIEAFKGAGRGYKKFDKWIGDKAVERDLLGEAARQYAARLEERYNTMSVLGMAKPVSLKSIYVRVNVLEKIQERLHRSLEDLEVQFQRDTRRFGKIVETKAGIDVVSKTMHLMVLGKPGAGKTTFLKHLIFQALGGKLPEKYVPIFVSLKDWSDEGTDLLDYITKEFGLCNLPEARPWIKHLLKKGKCLLLLDGLDEITENTDTAIRKIRGFSDKYDKNRIVISCRIAAYNSFFERFTDVEMADFDDEQIEAFIRGWFAGDEKTAVLCWEKLRAHPPTKELASVPLLLVLLCLAFDETMEFPTNRAELYQEAIDALLKKWDASRRIKREAIYKNLTLRRKVDLLSHIAYRTFSEGQYFIPQRVLESHIAEYIGNFQEVTDVSLMPDSEAILRAIEAHHGLLIKRATWVYSFSHLTVQEFFTARHVEATQGQGSVSALIDGHAGEPRWSEVVALAAGMMNDATQLVQGIRALLREELVAEDPAHMETWGEVWKYARHAARRPLTVELERGIDDACSLFLESLEIWPRMTRMTISVSEAHRNTAARMVSLMENLVACIQPHCYVAKETREAILAGDLADV